MSSNYYRNILIHFWLAHPLPQSHMLHASETGTVRVGNSDWEVS